VRVAARRNNSTKIASFCAVAFLCLCGTSFTVASAQETKRPFTVADEIGLTLFGTLNGGAPEVHFSPDGNYFAVWSERGSLDRNLLEDSLRFYRSQDVEDFLKPSGESQPPSPVWAVNLSGKEAPIISNWRWLSDSSGVAFLQGCGEWSDKRLLVADLRKRKIEPLTSGTEAVDAFDVSDRRHFVYSALEGNGRRLKGERASAATVGTGRPLHDLIFPDDSTWPDRRNKRQLWAVVDGKRFAVNANGAPLVPQRYLALSPDGRFLVTALKVEVPASWEALYLPPYALYPYNELHVGSQRVVQYVLIDLQAGSVRALTDAPVSGIAGWSGGGDPKWSGDGHEILLPGTFIKSPKGAPSRPCIAVVDLPSLSCTCVETLKASTENGGHEEGYHGILSVRFAGGDKQRVTVIFYFPDDISSRGTSEYVRGADGVWRLVGQSEGEHESVREGLEVRVVQGFDKPPLLIGTKKGASKVIWNPNPQLKDIELGQARTYKWKGKDGRERKSGLFMPSNYKPGQRYPLVIQTHGFEEFEFKPSGVFPTAFAARALAAAGMLVLQTGVDCRTGMSEEGPCAASGYEAAANRLVSEGLADPERIGIIGFSRSCFYVMETLTLSSLHLKAASITDGVMADYWQYILLPDLSRDSDALIGASPFGEGLQRWLKQSPGFNLERVNLPLLVVSAEGPFGLLFMWEPYAGLRYLHKPVDLIMLNTYEHVLTNPAVRMASQSGSVDWFRFWLQDYEDPDPAKAEQYKRWGELRKMQAENDAKYKAAKEKPAPVN